MTSTRPLAAPALPLAQRLRGVASSPVRDLLALASRPEVISFAGGLPAPELFDVDGVRAAFDAVLSGPGARTALQYAPTEGSAELRALLAARTSGRGLATTADDVLITTGSQQALALLSTALLDPGAVVAVEEPTYLAALQGFALAGARVVPVASDDDGVVPASLERVLEEHSPALVYLVPTFANPTGRTLSASRRAEVAALLADRPTWVVEDDPYGELRYRGEALAPLASQPALEGRAVYLGSLSKVFAPGLRLGWLRAPRELRVRLAVAKQAADLHTSTVDQAAAAAYLTATDLDAHVAGLRTAYGARRDAALESLPSVLPPGVGVDRSGRRHVRVGAPARGRRHRGPAARGTGARRRLRARGAVLRRSARPLDAAAVLHHPLPRAHPRGPVTPGARPGPGARRLLSGARARRPPSPG
ncbi:MAG: PLP-dependent aminotransferase family protein [Quadrisphaera sp.]